MATALARSTSIKIPSCAFRSRRTSYKRSPTTTSCERAAPSRHVLVRAVDRGPGSFGNDASSDVVFMGKLAIISFAGAAVIKYGSLLTDVPFQANGLLAVALVMGPPAAYAALLWNSQPPKL